MSEQHSNSGSNFKFYSGLVLIIAGAVVCLNMFLLAVGIPIFAIGAALVFISKKSVLTKVITVLTPVILWFAVFKLMERIIIHAKSEIVVTVPDEFSGQVRIVYGEESGMSPQETDNKMQLEVPANGVLIIKPSIKAGIQDVTYSFKTKNGVPFSFYDMSKIGDQSVKRPAVFYEGTISPETQLDYLYIGFQVLRNESDQVANANAKNTLTDSLVTVSRAY
ncbi:MAG TPA: hypothetical protein VGF30_12965 [Bacteroidia bacterium]